MRRVTPLVTGQTYHVYTKSIYGYVVFPTEREYERMIQIMRYYLTGPHERSFSQFIRSCPVRNIGFDLALKNLHTFRKCGGAINIIAYCLMPTHIHLILKQETDSGIEGYMKRVLSGFSQYFNQLHNRKGPLWQTRFGASLIQSDEQLIEKIAYVHNNPVKDLGIARQEDWPYSSKTSTLSGSVEVNSFSSSRRRCELPCSLP